ncbi:hypothetical protein JF66_12680, partial [Cryobacterium sp. MLB-32]
PDAHKIDQITYQEALQKGLKVVDSTAFSLCMDNNMPMQVFGMAPDGNVTAAILVPISAPASPTRILLPPKKESP